MVQSMRSSVQGRTFKMWSGVRGCVSGGGVAGVPQISSRSSCIRGMDAVHKMSAEGTPLWQVGAVLDLQHTHTHTHKTRAYQHRVRLRISVVWCGVVWYGVVWCGVKSVNEFRVIIYPRQIAPLSHAHAHAVTRTYLGLTGRTPPSDASVQPPV